MTLIPQPERVIRNISGISESQMQRIHDYLQGAVYCWCKNRPSEWFSVRHLFGGENFDWNGTPMIELFVKHQNEGKVDEQAIEEAGKDAGRILKHVLDEDERLFDTVINFTREYRWRQ